MIRTRETCDFAELIHDSDLLWSIRQSPIVFMAAVPAMTGVEDKEEQHCSASDVGEPAHLEALAGYR